MLILSIVMWYLCKLVHSYWVILGNMIMMLHTMVDVYTRIWKKSYRGSEAPENHVIFKELAAWRSELVDSDALESAFFR